jgi:ADP-heptose:LPS heptosyltransferase
LIGLHPFARDDAKRWPAACFVETGRRLRNEAGGSVVLLGNEDDRAAGDRIAAAIGDPVRNLAGATTLGALAAVVVRLAVLVGNDSGPAHLASALGTPSAVLFGPTEPAEWGPPATGPHRVVGFDAAEPAAEWHPSLDRTVAAALDVMTGQDSDRRAAETVEERDMAKIDG